MTLTNNRWVLLAAHFGINLILGGVYAFSYYKGSLIQQYGWDSSMLAIAFSINFGIIPIPMVLGGLLIDKGYGKTVILVGGIIFALGFILSGFVSSLAMFYITYGLINGFGSGMCFAGTLNNIIKFFPDKRGLASGIVLAGVGLGTLICTQLAKYFINIVSVDMALVYIGLIYLITFLVLSFFLKSAPSKEGGLIPASPMDKNYLAMIKDPRFYVLSIILAIGVFIGLVISSSSAQIGAEMFGIISIAFVVSFVSIANSGGRLIWGAVSDWIGTYNTLTLVFVIMAILMSLLLFGSGNSIIYYIGALGIGFTYAGVLAVFPSIVSRNFGMRNQGLNYGFIYVGFSIGALSAPYITSAVAQWYGDYSLVFIVSIILAVIGVALIFPARKLTNAVAHKVGGDIL